MAPWSWWSQTTATSKPSSQHQKEHQESTPPSPSSPVATPKSDPSTSQTPILPMNGPPRIEAKDAAQQEMPSPTELWQIGARSLQTGMFTGGVGLVFGAGVGIVRSAPPALFALFAGLQWFALGSSYTASRDLLHHAWGGEENMRSSDLMKASGVAGGVSGMVGGLIRGPKNVVPGILVFGTLGAGASYVSQGSRLAEGHDARPKTSWLDSKWSPMQKLSDKAYMEKLEEKLLRFDAEIAVIDDNIALLKSSQSSVSSQTSTAK
ncbi:hypothetical protein F4808DRAFT_427557 [Astrocystis sublimbata]|nr:hypothetical protein F4808DRAFT_427557 [Astrocystis sublimbata]